MVDLFCVPRIDAIPLSTSLRLEDHLVFDRIGRERGGAVACGQESWSLVELNTRRSLRVIPVNVERGGVMPKLTQEMKDMVAAQQCFIATADKDGIPNVGPKRSTRVLDDSTLIFTEGTGGATYRNILDGSKIAVAVVDREIPDGFRFLCRGELKTDGEAFEQAKAISLKNFGTEPKGVVMLHIEEINSLKPGPGAGKSID